MGRVGLILPPCLPVINLSGKPWNIRSVHDSVFIPAIVSLFLVCYLSHVAFRDTLAAVRIDLRLEMLQFVQLQRVYFRMPFLFLLRRLAPGNYTDVGVYDSLIRAFLLVIAYVVILVCSVSIRPIVLVFIWESWSELLRLWRRVKYVLIIWFVCFRLHFVDWVVRVEVKTFWHKLSLFRRHSRISVPYLLFSLSGVDSAWKRVPFSSLCQFESFFGRVFLPLGAAAVRL